MSSSEIMRKERRRNGETWGEDPGAEESRVAREEERGRERKQAKRITGERKGTALLQRQQRTSEAAAEVQSQRDIVRAREREKTRSDAGTRG